MNLKKGQRLMSARLYEEGMLQNPNRYKKSLPPWGPCRKPVRTPGNS